MDKNLVPGRKIVSILQTFFHFMKKKDVSSVLRDNTKDNFTQNMKKMNCSLSRKIVNTRENFWSVYCFATIRCEMKPQKDNRQTAAGISHNLIRNNELALSSARNLQFSFCISLKKLFFTTNQHQSLDSVCSKTKLPNWPKSECKLWKFTTVQVHIMGKGFSATSTKQ